MSLALVRDTVAPVAPARPIAAAQPELMVRDLSVGYGEAPPIFTGVGFTVGRGERVALIGANGAGKSTLLKCCLGFVKPRRGEVAVFGKSMAGLRAGEQRSLRGGIGFVAQKHNLVPRLSVLSNVVHGTLAEAAGPRRWLHGLAPRAVRERAYAALDMVGLADLALRRADALSGGQSQRVAIARALVAEPRMMLADEPAASLDPAAGEEVMEVFVRVSRETGTTLIFTTHHLDHALRCAERVIGLAGGGLHLDAPAATLVSGSLRGLYD
jgi:phosphonate transport system ATP-binding protein